MTITAVCLDAWLFVIGRLTFLDVTECPNCTGRRNVDFERSFLTSKSGISLPCSDAILRHIAKDSSSLTSTNARKQWHSPLQRAQDSYRVVVIFQLSSFSLVDAVWWQLHSSIASWEIWNCALWRTTIDTNASTNIRPHISYKSAILAFEGRSNSDIWDIVTRSYHFVPYISSIISRDRLFFLTWNIARTESTPNLVNG